MLYTLIMLVCLTDAPKVCQSQELLLGDIVLHPGTAFMQAQPLVAQWSASHPGYVVRRWRLHAGRDA